MANKFYQPGQERAARVEDLFATIAPRYDLINDLQSLGLHRHWKRKLIRLAEVKTGDRALDVCCGTGDISIALAAAGAEVAGLDFSAAMLAVAKKRSPIQFLQGDAMNLPFPDNSFDIVAIGYGLRNLSSWERGLEEMWRVAKPGARLLVLDFGKPDNSVWRQIYFAYLKWLVPLFGKIFCKDSATHAYIFASLQHYPAQRGVAEKMKTLGAADVHIHNLCGGAMSINFCRKP